jgi:hypothetical protein
LIVLIGEKSQKALFCGGVIIQLFQHKDSALAESVGLKVFD